MTTKVLKYLWTVYNVKILFSRKTGKSKMQSLLSFSQKSRIFWYLKSNIVNSHWKFNKKSSKIAFYHCYQTFCFIKKISLKARFLKFVKNCRRPWTVEENWFEILMPKLPTIFFNVIVDLYRKHCNYYRVYLGSKRFVYQNE